MTELHWIWIGLAVFVVGTAVLMLASGGGRSRMEPGVAGRSRTGRCRLSVEMPFVQEARGGALAAAVARSFDATPLRVEFESPDYYDRTLSMIFAGPGVRDQDALVREFKVRLKVAMEELGFGDRNVGFVRVEWL